MAPPKCVILKFDFYLPEYNTVLEYDGIQHYKPSFGKKSFEITSRNDKIKNDYLKEKNIRLIRIPYTTTGIRLINFLESVLNI
jgi:very-short-patch-repair endonuclease